jgi:hypothetical protein
MTLDVVKALTDDELVQVIAWAHAEVKARTEHRKQEAIAKIKALANTVGVSVSIAGGRGRPAKPHLRKRDPGN